MVVRLNRPRPLIWASARCDFFMRLVLMHVRLLQAMFKTLLVPTDGSAFAQRAIDAALTFASFHKSRIIVLGVADTRMFQSTEQQAAADGAVVEMINRSEAEQSVAAVADQAERMHIACETVVVVSSFPALEIINTAKRFDCDAIFMATRSQMGVLDTALNESQTQYVLRHVSIPVLVFPQPESA